MRPTVGLEGALAGLTISLPALLFISFTLNLQLLRMILSRSTKFLWLVGSLETLESTGDRTLNMLSKFMKASSSTYRRFEDQNDWKR